MNTTTRLGDLENGAWFTLDGYDYRVITRWSTGVEIKGATSAGERRVLAPDTVVAVASKTTTPNTCQILGTCGPDRHEHSGLCARHCNQQSVCWAERNSHDTVAQGILANLSRS